MNLLDVKNDKLSSKNEEAEAMQSPRRRLVTALTVEKCTGRANSSLNLVFHPIKLAGNILSRSVSFITAQRFLESVLILNKKDDRESLVAFAGEPRSIVPGAIPLNSTPDLKPSKFVYSVITDEVIERISKSSCKVYHMYHNVLFSLRKVVDIYSPTPPTTDIIITKPTEASLVSCRARNPDAYFMGDSATWVPYRAISFVNWSMIACINHTERIASLIASSIDLTLQMGNRTIPNAIPCPLSARIMVETILVKIWDGIASRLFGNKSYAMRGVSTTALQQLRPARLMTQPPQQILYFSFDGSGGADYGMYALGAATCLKTFVKPAVLRAARFAGSRWGAVVAGSLAANVDLATVKSGILNMANHRSKVGFQAWFGHAKRVKAFFDLWPKELQGAQERLHIYRTSCRFPWTWSSTPRNSEEPRFKSSSHFIACLNEAIVIPAPWVEIDISHKGIPCGALWSPADSDLSTVTITISAIPGTANISPESKGERSFTAADTIRTCTVEELEGIWCQGYADAHEWITNHVYNGQMSTLLLSKIPPRHTSYP